MAVQNYGNLLINFNVVKYEGEVDIQDGAITRNYNPQVNGSAVITSDITTNKSTINIPIRVTPESNADFDEFYDLGDANTIVFRDKSYSRCVMVEKPSRQDMQVVTYVFHGDPAA